ncbi:hypothetical protein CWI39_0961p0020 [Hamiltosporidium magnivora]|uniref:Uncharacterized protein n=1 Tax=Hamiltosporidium magnivora TaxID=148818 RepID=A0A4V6MVD4_9MICR|nr:hypothetical protein CWI39_0961p0020 [Hamiltosporidium magnivora]
MYLLWNGANKLIIILGLFINLSKESFDLTEHKDYFARKCSDLYTKETKNLQQLPNTIDCGIFMFYARLYTYAAVSIANYIKNSISEVFDVVFYRPDPSNYEGSKKISYKVFRLNKLNDKFLYVSRYYQLEESTHYATGLGTFSYILLKNDKTLTYFMAIFFQMYKIFGYLARTRDNIHSSYIKIQDITNSKRTKIPKKFEMFQVNTFYSLQHRIFYVKLFAEIYISEKLNISKDKMVQNFNSLFGASKCVFSGSYSYYYIENKRVETKNSGKTNISWKSNVRRNTILIRHELTGFKPLMDLYLLKNVKHTLKESLIEYEYYDEDDITTGKPKKFRVVFRYNSAGFEFNSNCFVDCIVKTYRPDTSIYIIALWCYDFNIVECEREAVDSNKFRISGTRKYNILGKISLEETQCSTQRVLSIKDFLGELFFNRELGF